MRLISPEQTLELERGAFAVCIPVKVADRQTLTTIRCVVEHTESPNPILLVGPTAPIQQIAYELGTELGTEGLLGLVVERDGEVAAVNEAARVTLPADLVVVVPGIAVAAGWLQRLRDAARSDTTVASATPLSMGVGGVAIFTSDPPVDALRGGGGDAAREPQGTTVEAAKEAARRVSAKALRLNARIATMGPGCLYIRHTAWELVGPLEVDGSLADALAAMAIKAIALGMVHVVADDVLVASLPGGHSVGDKSASTDDRARSEGERDALLGGPVQETIARDEHGPLRRSLDGGRTALRRLSVTIDGRALTTAVGGTQTYIIELSLALAREQRASVRVLVAPDISARAEDALAEVPEVELLSYEEALRDPPRTDVVHRPQQVFTPDDLALLRLVGERIVIGQQDLIAFHNHTYHRDLDAWRAYRRTTRLAMAAADQVIFFSEHARRDALAEDLLAEHRAHVVGIGMEALEPTSAAGDPPGDLSASDPFLLCLGADYAHKNRPFAIALVGALNGLGWSGKLVLAGTHVAHGSSREREVELLARDPALASSVVDLGTVDEAGKQWLYAHANALLYPTLYEGFGLIPLEAARAGLPCLFAAQASLAELAPGMATLIPWDAPASALSVMPLLSDGPARDAHLAELRSLATQGWREVAVDLLRVYERALLSPASQAAPRAWQELDREDYIVRLDRDMVSLKAVAEEYQNAYHALDERVSFGLPLVDRGGLLSRDQQRGLMRIASRRRLAAVLLAPFGLMGRPGGGAESDQ